MKDASLGRDDISVAVLFLDCSSGLDGSGRRCQLIAGEGAADIENSAASTLFVSWFKFVTTLRIDFVGFLLGVIIGNAQ